MSGWDLDCSAIAEDPAFVHRANVDITDEATVNAAFEGFTRPLDRFGPGRQCGDQRAAKPAEYSLEEWQRTIDVDLTGCFIVKPAVMHMRAHDYGRIVIMASVAGKEKTKRLLRCRESRGDRLRQSLSRELQPSKVTVNCIAPAITAELFEMTPEYVAEEGAHSYGRFYLNEIAAMTAWVAALFVPSPRDGCSMSLVGGRLSEMPEAVLPMIWPFIG